MNGGAGSPEVGLKLRKRREERDEEGALELGPTASDPHKTYHKSRLLMAEQRQKSGETDGEINYCRKVRPALDPTFRGLFLSSRV
jgi:hypothetical protein